ncbi:SpoIIE family protein phosphatase [Nonomuraea sp. NPDC049714]|uniref:SpoIIE family protein phosphatase n=1 Tax=Nonomuraea sp. NPDC049714 TaxID=3364357 RepID=UPI0037B9EDFC
MAHIRGGEGPSEEEFERFLHGEQVGRSVRPVILRSWRRCQAVACTPDKLGFPDPVEIDQNAFLVRAARPILDRVHHVVENADAALLLVDDQARLVLRYLSDPGMRRYFDKVGAVPGTTYAESAVGTNGTGTALRERRLTRVAGFEHPATCVQPFTGTGVPILDPLTGHALGVVSIVCPNERDDPAMSILVQQVAERIERRLLEQSSERERDLFQTYLRAGGLTGPPPAEGAGHLLRELPRGDRFLLEEKAVGLIALGRRAAIEIPLSHGRTAMLRAVPTTEPTAVTGSATPVVGVVAQVRIQDGPWEPLTDVPAPGVADLVNAPPLVPSPATSVAGDESPDPGLLLFGEPGVGKLAVAARKRIRLLYEAATNIGRTLDVERTAEELAEATVPRLADHVTIDLHESVLRGEEPADPGTGLRRVATRAVRENLFPIGLGKPVHYLPTSPQADCLLDREAVLWPDSPENAPSGYGIGSLIAVPLIAHDRVLGVATFMRLGGSGPFEDDDVSIAVEMVRHAAVCVDNARRFTRERTMVRALQQSMLPRSLPEQTAIDVAHRYLPAQEAAGHDWFDVICLSGARVALVVGDVADRGLHGVATMGRLRTAVGNFASLDMLPADILNHLDDLVRRLSHEEADPAGGDEGHLTRTTCAYAVYDPTSRRCALACAGHPPPAVVYPDGSVEFLDLPTGQPLGLGGSPFETAEVELPEGSMLVLYTKGLLADDPRAGAERLRLALGQANGSAEQTATSVLATVPPDDLTDDVTVLVARTRALEPDHVASWDLASDPAVVSRVRGEVAGQLAAWDLEHLAFNTELIFSELVTNAIRYGSEPIRARMILDRMLICEVSDASESSPRPRRAVATDEGGRGLFLVAHIAECWGTRYTHRGKVIWAEQPLTGGADEPADLSAAFSFFADDDL